MARRRKDILQEEPVEITDMIKQDFGMYALSTQPRAIPRTSDGLKEIHRRLLYTLYHHRGGFVKSARVIGDCIGRYSPHGDLAAYTALVALTQDFKRPIPYAVGQGNWGSIDGDSAAAQRYTEVKISPFAEDIFFGPEFKYCDFRDNYDGTELEPSALSPKIPMLVINGAFGLVAGYQTNIPTHNFVQTCNDAIEYIKSGEIKHIKHPDFPTGGFVQSINDSIQRGITTGSGRFRIIPRTETKDIGYGKVAIEVLDMPYGTSKDSYVTRFLNRLKDECLVKKTNDYYSRISDIKDYSTDKNNIRISIVFKKTVSLDEAKKINKHFIQNGYLSEYMNYSTIAIPHKGDGVHYAPERLSLKQLIKYWYEYRVIVLKRYFTDNIKTLTKKKEILSQVILFINNFQKLSAFILNHDTPAIIKEFHKHGISKDATEYIMKSSFNRFKNKSKDIITNVRDIDRDIKMFKKHSRSVNKYMLAEIEEIKQKYGTGRHYTNTKLIK